VHNSGLQADCRTHPSMRQTTDFPPCCHPPHHPPDHPHLWTPSARTARPGSNMRSQIPTVNGGPSDLSMVETERSSFSAPP